MCFCLCVHSQIIRGRLEICLKSETDAFTYGDELSERKNDCLELHYSVSYLLTQPMGFTPLRIGSGYFFQLSKYIMANLLCTRELPGVALVALFHIF